MRPGGRCRSRMPTRTTDLRCSKRPTFTRTRRLRQTARVKYPQCALLAGTDKASTLDGATLRSLP
eukprot:11002389-Alexandrium_andersonii.AAC.1